MKVNIVMIEEVNSWILGKFALKLQKNLEDFGIKTTISKKPDLKADINHYIIYRDYLDVPSDTDTLMITHVDRVEKLKFLKQSLETAKMGICMSKDTMSKLVKSGIDKDKLSYINPAHDEMIKPKKYVLGITTRLYSDGRKKSDTIVDLCKSIKPEYFKFKIMGSGWSPVIKEITAMGFEVEYFEAFDYDCYLKLIPQFDYYLYLSHDEGSMGFVDALSAGVKTIVTKQGFHMDAKNGLTHPINDTKDLIETLKRVSDERQKLIDSVQSWTWKNYAIKHVHLWNYLLKKDIDEKTEKSFRSFDDGFNSIFLEDNEKSDFNESMVFDKKYGGFKSYIMYLLKRLLTDSMKVKIKKILRINS